MITLLPSWCQLPGPPDIPHCDKADVNGPKYSSLVATTGPVLTSTVEFVLAEGADVTVATCTNITQVSSLSDFVVSLQFSDCECRVSDSFE